MNTESVIAGILLCQCLGRGSPSAWHVTALKKPVFSAELISCRRTMVTGCRSVHLRSSLCRSPTRCRMPMQLSFAPSRASSCIRATTSLTSHRLMTGVAISPVLGRLRAQKESACCSQIQRTRRRLALPRAKRLSAACSARSSPSTKAGALSLRVSQVTYIASSRLQMQPSPQVEKLRRSVSACARTCSSDETLVSFQFPTRHSLT